MEIKRNEYLERLKIRKDNGMIKIITGIRRCGKSFLLFVLFKKYLLESGVDNDHIIEIALDGIENEELRDPKKCYQYIVGRHIVTGDYRILFRAISPVAVCVLRADCTLSKVKLQSIAALFQLPLHGQLK